MHPEPGYLYKVEFVLKRDGKSIDTYRRKLGFRTIRWDNTSLYINDKKAYLRGFGKHEDSDVSIEIFIFKDFYSLVVKLILEISYCKAFALCKKLIKRNFGLKTCHQRTPVFN